MLKINMLHIYNPENGQDLNPSLAITPVKYISLSSLERIP